MRIIDFIVVLVMYFMPGKVGLNYIEDEKRRIVALYSKGITYSEIASRCRLADPCSNVTSTGAARVINRTKKCGYYKSKPKERTGPRLPEHVLKALDERVKAKPDATSRELQAYIFEHSHYLTSARQIRYLRAYMGYKAANVKYCQIITAKNMKKRLQFVQQFIPKFLDLTKMIFTDESMVQLGGWRRKIYIKPNAPKFSKCRPIAKYPFKIMIWAGISWQGATDCLIIKKKPARRGKKSKARAIAGGDDMRKKKTLVNSAVYKDILRHYIRFTNERYPGGDGILVQDNAKIHTSKNTVKFINEKGINYDIDFWPAESPDINCIECVWHELKLYLMAVYLPKNKAELLAGIREFWSTRMTVDKCRAYILHVLSVLDLVIENNGGPADN